MSPKKEDPQQGIAASSIMTVKEVSLLLRIPVSTIYDLASKGKIRGVKFGKHWRFMRADVESYLRGESRPTESQKRREHREFPRIKTEIIAQAQSLLERNQKFSYQGVITNLSQGGLCFVYQKEAHKGFEAGDPVTLTFQLPDMLPLAFKIKARVVHEASNGTQTIGVKFRLLDCEQLEVIRHYVG